MKLKRFWVSVILLMPGIAVAKQASPTDVHSEIQRIYNFQPHALDDRQIAQKSVVLDHFWSKAKSQSAIFVPALRKELTDFTNPPFFLYDGSKLLLSLSNTPADRKVVIAAVAHSDLRDLQYMDYFMLVHNMAGKGEDTTAAALHILDDPKFQVFIPQHDLTLAQNYCLVYMLLPTNQDFWIGPAIQRLRTEKDVTAEKSLLLLLFYAQTLEADQAVSNFSRDATMPAAARSYANELTHRKDSISAIDRAAAQTSNETSLRKARQERMKAVSDEALDDLDSYTSKIMVKRR